MLNIFYRQLERKSRGLIYNRSQNCQDNLTGFKAEIIPKLNKLM